MREGVASGRVRWMSVPRIAYDIVPPTLRGFVRFTFSSIAFQVRPSNFPFLSRPDRIIS